MPHGLQIFKADGTKVFDSDVAQGGWLADVVPAPAGGGVVAFPEFPGRVAFVTELDGQVSIPGSFFPIVDYGLGHPRVTFNAVLAGRFYAVFIQ